MDITDCHSTRGRAYAARLVFALAVTLFAMIPPEPVSAQGPLRRLGERIRQRAAGPVLPPVRDQRARLPLRQRIVPPQTPAAEPTLPASPLPDSPRVRAARPPMPQPSASPAGSSRRSANFNRPAERVAAPQPADPSAWRSRTEPPPRPSPDASVAGAVPGDRGGPAGPAVLPPPADETAIQSAAAEETPRRRRLGVTVDEPPALPSPTGLPRRARGAWVTEVEPNSPAAAAGMRPDDLIVAVDGRLVTSVRDLVDELAQFGVGDEFQLQYFRDNRLGAARVRYAETAAAGSTPQTPAAESDRSLLGGFGSVLGGLMGGSRRSDSGAAADRPTESTDLPPEDDALEPGERPVEPLTRGESSVEPLPPPLPGTD